MSESTLAAAEVNTNTTPATDPVIDPAKAAAELAAHQAAQTAWAVKHGYETAPSAEEQVQTGSAEAAEKAAALEAEQREAAVELLKQAVKAFRKGEAAYKAGLLEAGRLSAEHIRAKLALGDKRGAAVQGLEAAMAPWASSKVDVNRLVRVWAAWHLLAEETGLVGEGKARGPADVVPYGTYTDHWCRLVMRSRAEGDESYVLLPGLEEECQAAFAKAVKDGLSKAAVADLVGKLVRDYEGQEAKAEAVRQEQARKAEAEQKERTRQAAVEVEEAQRKALAALQAKKADANEQTTAAVAESLAELQSKQRAMVEEQARAEQAEKDRKAADKAKADQDARLAKAAEKAQRKAAAADQKATLATPGAAAGQTTAVAREGTTITGNLLRSAKSGTVKDVAEMAAELVTGGDAPDDVFEELLRVLKASKELSKRSGRAIDAALVVLTRKSGPSPVELAGAQGSANGTPAAAVA